MIWQHQSGNGAYLAYPDFETDSHPALKHSVKLSLRTREIDCFDYAISSIDVMRWPSFSGNRPAESARKEL